jgi:hypothetical protein
VTVPEPVPALVTVTVYEDEEVVVAVKVAVHDTARLGIVNVDAQTVSPLQPAKAEPLAGVAVSVTVTPVV